MSVILDIFDEMIGAISSLRRNFKKSVIYLAPIGIGMVLGVLLLSGFLSGMLQSHPVEMQLFFIGGSLREVFRWWTHKALEEPFRRHSLLALIATLAVMLCIFFIRPTTLAQRSFAIPAFPDDSAIAVCGICGSGDGHSGGQRLLFPDAVRGIPQCTDGGERMEFCGTDSGGNWHDDRDSVLCQRFWTCCCSGTNRRCTSVSSMRVGSIPNIWPSQPIQGMDILWVCSHVLQVRRFRCFARRIFLRSRLRRHKH